MSGEVSSDLREGLLTCLAYRLTILNSSVVTQKCTYAKRACLPSSFEIYAIFIILVWKHLQTFNTENDNDNDDNNNDDDDNNNNKLQ